MNGYTINWQQLRVMIVMIVVVIVYVLWAGAERGIITSELRLPIDLGSFAGWCVLIAFLTSIVTQLLKEQGKMRARVHRSSIKEWLDWRFNLELPQTPVRETKSQDPDNSGKAVQEIEELCAAGSSLQFFYDLPTEQFCGQIATAVDFVMLAPKSYPHAFAAFTSGDRPEHRVAVNEFVTSQTLDREPPTDQASATLQTRLDEGDQSASQTRPKQIGPDEYDRLRARVTNYAQRALDGLQLVAMRRWKQRLMFTNFLVSFSISWVVASIADFPWLISNRGVWMFFYSNFIFAVAGALLAPVAYDITSAIRGLRGR